VQTPAQRAPHPRPQGQPEIDAGSWAQWYADSGRAQPGQCGGFARAAWNHTAFAECCSGSGT